MSIFSDTTRRKEERRLKSAVHRPGSPVALDDVRQATQWRFPAAMATTCMLEGAKHPMTQITPLACACGQVQLEAERAPILSTECHCNSCRTAGARLEAAPGVSPILEANGGTRFVLYRKDRVRFLQGAELLRELRLTSRSPTRRVVASCCSTPVFLEFENGHWLSLYSGLWPPGALPLPDLRTMTSDLPNSAALTDAVPSGKRQTAMFYAKLLSAWIAMGFKSPKIAVNGTFQANGTGSTS
jgi:hypothetical protein